MDSGTASAELAVPIDEPARRLRVISYNVQVGISTSRPHHYVLHSWKHVLPHTQRLHNIERVAQKFRNFDIVGLQEVDAGSLRSNYINLTEYMAHVGGFTHWHHQVNRNLGHFAQHSNGILSRLRPSEISDLKLPGMIPGRRAIMARYGSEQEPLVVSILHLALGRRARSNQLDYLSDLVNSFPHVILMGDFNCPTASREMNRLFNQTHLHEPLEQIHTFPSWRPQRTIDHILVTPALAVNDVHIPSLHAYSDHLPIAMEIELPRGVDLTPEVPRRF